MYLKLLFVAIILIISRLTSDGKPKPTYDTVAYRNIEAEIQKKFTEIRNLNNYDERMNLSHEVETIFDTLLYRKESFLHPFDSLQNLITCLYSDDKQFRIVNWNIPKPDATYHYFGYIQYFDRKNDTLTTTKLHDKHDQITNAENAILSADNWYGALYYEIIPTKISGKNRIYILLGYEGYTLYAKRKIIEVLWFDNGKPFFGKEVFQLPKGKQKRIIFTYNYRARMKLRWDPDLWLIVFDRLERVPTLPATIEGNMAPSLIFDGLQWTGQEWRLKENIDVTPKPRKKIKTKRKKYPY